MNTFMQPFNPDARITTLITNDGDAITGTVIQHLSNGRKNTWEVENGVANQQTMYYESGQIERIVEMNRGTVHGKFLMYYPDGTKYVEQHYENGEPVGTWYRWDKNGELVDSKVH